MGNPRGGELVTKIIVQLFRVFWVLAVVVRTTVWSSVLAETEVGDRLSNKVVHHLWGKVIFRAPDYEGISDWRDYFSSGVHVHAASLYSPSSIFCSELFVTACFLDKSRTEGVNLSKSLDFEDVVKGGSREIQEDWVLACFTVPHKGADFACFQASSAPTDA